MFHVQGGFEWVNVLWYQPTCSPEQRAVKRLCVSAHTVDVAGDIMFLGYLSICGYINIHTHTFNGPLSGTTQVSRYQKDKTNLDFIGARDSERQWHQLGHMQICPSL